MNQILLGMKYLHDNNIMHRDIKLQNILLHDNIVKICDFGFSTTYKSTVEMFNTMCGTPLFMCPETLFLKPYSIKSEIWSLGILFYYIIYGYHPFYNLKDVNDYRLKINDEIYFHDICLFDNDISNLIIITTIKSMLNVDYEYRKSPVSKTNSRMLKQRKFKQL